MMAQNHLQREVIVVGGGVAGMGAAIVWASMGSNVTVLERAQLPSPVDRGDVLHVRAARAIRSLGVDLTGLIAESNPLDRFEILDHRSRVLFGSVLSAGAVRHTALASVLCEHARGHGNIEMLANTPMRAILRDRHGRVVGVEAGHREHLGLVVMAAGSAAARLPGMPPALIEGRSYGERFVNLLVRSEGVPAWFQHTGLYVLSPRGVLVFVPLPGGLLRVGVQMLDGDRPAEGIDFLDEAAQRWPMLSEFGMTLEGPRVYRLQRTLARSMYVPGMLIVGDAAHTVHPVGGQGIGLAMEDLAELKTALTAMLGTPTRCGVDSVLAHYSDIRIQRVRRRTRPIDVLGRLSSRSVTRTAVGRSAVRPLNCHPAVQKKVVEALGACAVSKGIEETIAEPAPVGVARKPKTMHIPALDRFGAEILYDYFPEPLSPLDRDLLRSLVEVTLDVGRRLGVELAPAAEVLATTEEGATDVRPTPIGLTMRSAARFPLWLTTTIAQLRHNPTDWVEVDLKGSLLPRIDRLRAEVAHPGRAEDELLGYVEEARLLRDEVFTSRSPHFLPSFALKLAAPLLARISPCIADHADDTSSLDTPTSRLRNDLDALIQALQEDPASSQRSIKAFIGVHGGRGHTFVPLPSDEVWDVNAEPLNQMLDAQRGSSPRTPGSPARRMRGTRVSRAVARRLQEIAAARDWVTFGYEAATRTMRTAILILGDRLVERGLLHEPREVFLMTHAELDRAVRAGQAPRREALLARRSGHASVAGEATSPASSTSMLQGLAASPGVVDGIAIVVTDDTDLSKVKPGQILVCKMTTPSWLPLLRIAGGVVTDMGGFLSHAAIVARSFGIPAVTATGNATSWVRTGGRYRLDGDHGTLTATSSVDGSPELSVRSAIAGPFDPGGQS
jgi:2-polyprenyl-6-methoxyphenol hydroxylase-like FAD-dependent oxidoreductase/phosphohistidine swiveling domain-containing protein